MAKKESSQRGSAIIGFIIIPLVISAAVMVFGKISGEISPRDNSTQEEVSNSTKASTPTGIKFKSND